MQDGLWGIVSRTEESLFGETSTDRHLKFQARKDHALSTVVADYRAFSPRDLN